MLTIKGTRFNDNLNASGIKPSKVLGLGGNDRLDSGGTDKRHILDGGDGDDNISANRFAKKVFGGSGNDYITFVDGTICDGCGGGVLSDVVISGGSGSDNIQIKLRNSSEVRGLRIDGGTGDDIIYYTGTSSVNSVKRSKIMGGIGNDRIYISDTGLRDETKFYGGAGNDTFIFRDIPPARRTNVFGGKGRDTVEVDTSRDFELKGNSSEAVLTFAAYTLNGFGYQQQIFMKGIEVVSIGGEQIQL